MPLYLDYMSIISPLCHHHFALYPNYIPTIPRLYRSYTKTIKHLPQDSGWIIVINALTYSIDWQYHCWIRWLYIYIPWWSPFHSILSFLLVNSPDKMVIKPRVSPKTCRLRLGNCSHVRWWGWRRLAHLDSEIWLDLWDAMSPMGSIWPWSSWKKLAIHMAQLEGNWLGYFSSCLHLFTAGITGIHRLQSSDFSIAP